MFFCENIRRSEQKYRCFGVFLQIYKEFYKLWLVTSFINVKLKQYTKVSIVLFTLPKIITKETRLQEGEGLIHTQTIRLVCINEVHQYVMFGRKFRRDYLKLNNILLKNIQDTTYQYESSSNLHSFNTQLLIIIEEMTGLQVPTHKML